MTHNHYGLLCDIYTNFQSSNYGKEPEPVLNKANFFKHAPVFLIDCSKQNESLNSGPVDIRLEFKSGGIVSNQTSAYCLIIHGHIVEYNCISGNVRKLV